ncbi:rhomboid family intramembrane serine protease [Flavobacterium sp. ASW18X]|uniref:rhomboid family intramembrane serine protease n=1 Tax=Flavobacterium sp. ASW18X TaxID=2572595 RepID=UPI0010AE6DE3|nr:rhomboid family intramembrane serine protease [Flavobacterium sp. ASW18X]TKD62473.1 rhomboid family intramembrane serine protease [Flavobacterium sp. ASW18X]
MGRITEGIKHLIIINVIFFIAGISGLADTLYQYLALWFPLNPNFQIWQVFTHMFLHDFTGFMHILFNMYGLWAFGTPLERMWGRNKFLFFYFSAGLGAGLIHIAANYFFFSQGLDAVMASGLAKQEVIDVLASGRYSPDWYNLASKGTIDGFISAFNAPAVGASGAVYGILVAFAFTFPNAELMMIFLPIPIKAKYFVPLIILGDLVFGFSSVNTGIAHFAHIGGALIGFIMMWYWKKNQFNNNRWN